MNSPKYEADEKVGAVAVALTIVAVATIPAAFWASIAWLVWGRLPAIVVATIALLGSIFVIGLVRSGREVETPRPAAREELEPTRLVPASAMPQRAA